MQRTPTASATIEFTCPVCGTHAAHPAGSFHRELAACPSCGASARVRGMIHGLTLALYGHSYRLDQVPPSSALKGLGFSDPPSLAQALAAKYNYVSTRYDGQPRLDLLSEDWKQYTGQDFIICGDVMEHLPRPLEPAFHALKAMLKPGGVLVLTVPYARMDKTVEHFPRLHRFTITGSGANRTLINTRDDGVVETFDSLVFHEGGNSSLEMRVFGEADLMDQLARAGFADVTVHDQPVDEIGYYWPPLNERPELGVPLLGYVITARRP